MHTSLDFQPLFSWVTLAAILAPLTLLVLAGLVLRSRGAFIRFLALAALALALVNPVIVNEEREPLKSVVTVVVDRSQSQDLGNRQADSTQTLANVRQQLGNFPQFDVRVVDAGRSGSTSTRLFQALGGALRDVPPSRVGGAILITDGQVHDIPQNIAGLGFSAPLHALITGTPDEFDRRIRFVNAPRFGIATKPLELTYTVTDEGKSEAATGTARVEILVNGQVVSEENATIGTEMKAEITLPRAGVNIVEIRTDTLPGEVTGANNRAVAKIDGIRDNLKVLLVSGEPHNGERTWRNLLKSDASVDLVHFTILRPPEKQDGTPIHELSLIAFPTRELFVEKIEDFDLIILDRYQHREVMPLIYYDFISQYVENGGALLIAAGSEYAGDQSIAQTPLVSTLPAMPTGEVTEKAFYPRLTDLGKRHPVTRGLEGGAQEPPHWSRWFRIVGIDQPEGQVIMSGADNKPLLVLNRVGQGRVGMFMSDQGWLWARGFEGGGPYAALYRRIAHWLMQEPELEEEQLTADDNGGTLQIRRQTLGDNPGKASVVTPSGKTAEVNLTQSAPGIFTGTLETGEIGLFQIANGDLSTLAHVGPVDAPEFADSISTMAKLEPLASETGGSVRRLRPEAGQTSIDVPGIITVRGSGAASGASWIGLRETGDTALKSVNRLPLFSGFLALAAMLLVLGGVWYREGR
ncbi:membrane protein [Brucella endophytica]|uniref:Membrane protein n=1 Tax=Brucella endophytica TaxID=1963359 RepID=A0A916SKB1_9HYPH|nr:glutamine amidotransferase [Brucella endophytica]GGB05125.1 membrane protein [Brucella endophytica]